MIQLKPLGFRDYHKAVSLLATFEEYQDLHQTLRHWSLLFSLIQWVIRILPLAFKNFPTVYVAISRQKMLGLIWLQKDRGQSSRWQVNAVAICADADVAPYDIGTQLMNYAINRHGGDGVQTFVARVPHYNGVALNLYKSCGFRQVTRCHVFRWQNTVLPPSLPDIRGIREAMDADAPKLKALRDDILPVETRLALSPSSKIFTISLSRWLYRRFNGHFLKRWVLDEPVHEALMAAVTLETRDYQQFNLSVWVSPGWTQQFKTLLAYGVAKAHQHTSSPHITLMCYSFEKEALDITANSGFERAYELEILVKDYWVPLDQQKPALADPILLFGGRNPSTASVAHCTLDKAY